MGFQLMYVIISAGWELKSSKGREGKSGKLEVSRELRRFITALGEDRKLTREAKFVEQFLFFIWRN